MKKTLTIAGRITSECPACKGARQLPVPGSNLTRTLPCDECLGTGRVGPTTVTIKAPCIVTGEPYSVTAPYAGWKAWRAGELIQNALPELSKEDREFLMSGTSPAGWERLFPREPISLPEEEGCSRCGEPEAGGPCEKCGLCSLCDCPCGTFEEED